MNNLNNKLLVILTLVVTPLYIRANEEKNNLNQLQSNDQKCIEKDVKAIVDTIYSNDSKLSIDHRMHAINLAFHTVLGTEKEFIEKHGELPVDLREIEKPAFNKKSLRLSEYTILYGAMGAAFGFGLFCATHLSGWGSGSKIIDETRDISISVPGNILEYLIPLVGFLPGFVAGYGVGGLANLSDDTTEYEDLIEAKKEFIPCKNDYEKIFKLCMQKDKTKACTEIRLSYSSYKYFLQKLNELQKN